MRSMRRRTPLGLLLLVAVMIGSIPLFLVVYSSELVQPQSESQPGAVTTLRKARLADLTYKDERPTSSVLVPADFPAECSVLPPDFTLPLRRLTRHNPQVQASCDLLFKGDPEERRKVRSSMDSWKNSLTDKHYLRQLVSNCSTTRQKFLDNFYTSKLEREFPLAYIFLVHHKEGVIQQYLRLLKVLYRPHNVYCIHLDAKSPKWWRILVEQFSKCFSNIIVASKSVDVVYGTVRILQAHLSCFHELLQTELPWYYAINLHGTEVPLTTNRVLVELVKSMKGVNIVDIGENLTSSHARHARRKVKLSITWDTNGSRFYHQRTSFHPPFNMTLFKSAASANSALTREFVNFMLTNKRAKELLHFLHDFESAVELFFSTVNHFPDAPGNVYLLEKNKKMPLLAQRVWYFQTQQNASLCIERKLNHRICICSASDLPWLRHKMERRSFYFLNKYWIEYDHVIMDCMEDLLVKKNIEEYTRDCVSSEVAIEDPLSV